MIIVHVNIEGLDINYICEGEGKIILLLHGWGANIDTVMPIFNHLKSRYKVYAIDFPGHGKSQQPNEVWNSYDFANITKKFIDSLEIKEIILMGHSHGGRVSIILANQYPELIKRMVLIDSAGIIPRRSYKYYFKVYSFKTLKFLYTKLFFLSDKKERMEKFYKRFGSTDYREASGIMRSIMVKVINDDLRPLLSGIKASTLLIWGRDDTATPLYMAEIMEKEIKDSGLVIFDNAGHYSYLDQFHSFKIVIDNYLKGSE